MLRKGDGGLPSAGLHYLCRRRGAPFIEMNSSCIWFHPFFFRSGGVYLSLSASWCVCVGVPVCMFVPTPPPPGFVVALTGLC